MKTRNTLSILLALSLAVGCVGCGKKSSGDKLVFWQFWDTNIIAPMIEEFEARNPGIDVEVEQLTWQSGLEKIQAAIASGTQPDLCELGSTWVPRFSYEGVLEDLTDVYVAVADSFIMWESAMWRDKVYGLPWVQGTRVLFWNPALFARAGLETRWAPKYWPHVLEAAQRIDALGEDISGFGLNLGERYVLYKKFMAFAWGNGGDILSADGDVVYNSIENLETLDFYRQLAQYSLKEKQEVLDHAFKNGKLGMQISGAWNIRNYAEEAPDLSYRVALVPKPSPTHGQHASFAGAEMLVIFKGTKNRDAALKLARFLHGYPQAKKLAKAVQSVFPASRRAISPDGWDRYGFFESREYVAFQTSNMSEKNLYQSQMGFQVRLDSNDPVIGYGFHIKEICAQETYFAILTPTLVPEPGTLLLISSGLMLLFRNRKHNG